MSGKPWLIALILYGSGMRLLEALRMRVKDIDFPTARSMSTMARAQRIASRFYPRPPLLPFKKHLQSVRLLHQSDLKNGHGDVWLPYVLARNYPGASRQWMWQYAYPAATFSIDPRSQALRRHHYPEALVQRALKAALLAAGIHKPATPLGFRLDHGQQSAPAFPSRPLPGTPIIRPSTRKPNPLDTSSWAKLTAHRE